MKKFISMALVAIVAMVATMTFVSCGSDSDDETSGDTTVFFEASSTEGYFTSALPGAVKTYFQSNLSSLATVEASGNTSLNVTITTTSKNQSAVASKISSLSKDGSFQTAMENAGITGNYSFKIHKHNDNTTFYTFTYTKK